MNAPGSLPTTLLTALCAFALPGSGHFVAGHRRAGFLFAALWVLLPLAAVLLMLQEPNAFAAILCVAGRWLVSAVSAVHAAVLVHTRGRTPGAPQPRAIAFILVLMLGLASLLTLAGREFLARALRLPSNSMAPTLLVGDHVLADVRATSRDFRNGDVVVMRFPGDRRQMFAKRIVAMSGDTVEMRDRQLLLNGIPVPENYTLHEPLPLEPGSVSTRDNFPPYRVPDAHVFMLGDARENSQDSRHFGPVPTSDLLGRVAGIYWSYSNGVRWERIGRPVSAGSARAR